MSDYAEKLAQALQSVEYHWAHDNGPGCETCGYGGGVEIDYERLVEEIDKFAATFSTSPSPDSPSADK